MQKQTLPQRRRPHHNVVIKPNHPVIVFITVCTKNREPWLANCEVHEILISVWREATAWLVGRYVLMPDHVHLFASPGELDTPLGVWISYWKAKFSRGHKNPDHRWQTGYWDTQLRRSESRYLLKSLLVRSKARSEAKCRQSQCGVQSSECK